MLKVLIVSLVAGAFALGLLVPRGSSAPPQPDKGARFEYAVLKLTRTFPGVLGQPGAGTPPTKWTEKLVWSTADEEVEADGWDDWATRHNAPPAAKKESSETQRQLRVFNRLGDEGWEAYEREQTASLSPTTTTWSFKRRLP
jgi:hypothetical protein